MKKIMVILFLFVGVFLKSQQTELIENTWYLSELNINGETYYPPSNDEIDWVTMNIFMEDTQYVFFSDVCLGLSGLLNWVTNSQFSFFDFTGGFDCQNTENQSFELLYAQFYGTGGLEGIPFNYIINVSSESYSILIVTNQFGDTAIYTNDKLSTKEIQNNQITIYPNPVLDKIVLSNVDISDELKIRIFDSQGLLVMNVVSDNGNRAFDLSNLKSGLYIITVSNSSGEKLISKKIIKK